MIAAAGPGFDDWQGLLDLILTSFAGMTGRIDPPSSALALTPEALTERATRECLLLAQDAAGLAGCVFCAELPDALYIGKLAVHPRAQGKGLGRALVDAAGDHARALSLPRLRLETRVELTENHAAFARMGFAEAGRRSHPGYAAPTTLILEKPLW